MAVTWSDEYSRRFEGHGRAGMMDSSSRPNVSPKQTAAADAARIIALRRQRLNGKHIAMEVGMSPAIVSRVLKRAGLPRIKDLIPHSR